MPRDTSNNEYFKKERPTRRNEANWQRHDIKEEKQKWVSNNAWGASHLQPDFGGVQRERDQIRHTASWSSCKHPDSSWRVRVRHDVQQKSGASHQEKRIEGGEDRRCCRHSGSGSTHLLLCSFTPKLTGDDTFFCPLFCDCALTTPNYHNNKDVTTGTGEPGIAQVDPQTGSGSTVLRDLLLRSRDRHICTECTCEEELAPLFASSNVFFFFLIWRRESKLVEKRSARSRTCALTTIIVYLWNSWFNWKVKLLRLNISSRSNFILVTLYIKINSQQFKEMALNALSVFIIFQPKLPSSPLSVMAFYCKQNWYFIPSKENCLFIYINYINCTWLCPGLPLVKQKLGTELLKSQSELQIF